MLISTRPVQEDWSVPLDEIRIDCRSLGAGVEQLESYEIFARRRSRAFVMCGGGEMALPSLTANAPEKYLDSRDLVDAHCEDGGGEGDGEIRFRLDAPGEGCCSLFATRMISSS